MFSESTPHGWLLYLPYWWRFTIPSYKNKKRVVSFFRKKKNKNKNKMKLSLCLLCLTWWLVLMVDHVDIAGRKILQDGNGDDDTNILPLPPQAQPLPPIAQFPQEPRLPLPHIIPIPDYPFPPTPVDDPVIFPPPAPIIPLTHLFHYSPSPSTPTPTTPTTPKTPLFAPTTPSTPPSTH